MAAPAQATTEASMDNSTANCLALPPLNHFKMCCCEPIPNGTTTATAETTPSTADEGHKKAGRLLKSVKKDIVYIKNASTQLKKYEAQVADQIETTSKDFESLEGYFNNMDESSSMDTNKMVGICKNISDLQKDVTKLKLQITSKYKNQSAANSDANRNQRSNGSTQTGRDIARNEVNMPNLCKNEIFKHSSEFKDLKALYDGLDITHKICLLSFSVFPENEMINRRFMTYWWIGEGFVRPPPASQKPAKNKGNRVSRQIKRTAENLANEIKKQSEETAKNEANKASRQRERTEEDLAKEVNKQSEETAKSEGNKASRQSEITAEDLGNEVNKQSKETAKNEANKVSRQSEITAEDLGNEVNKQSKETANNQVNKASRPSEETVADLANEVNKQSEETAKNPANKASRQSEETVADLVNEVNKQSEETAEDLANAVFKQLMMKGFIEPVNEKRSLEVSRCKMHPFIRAAVIMLADKAQFFHFDPSGNLTAGFPLSQQVCLLSGKQLKDTLDLVKVHSVFNVDETILDFDKPEMFSRMRNANVLCLGRWQTSPKHHIEVEDTKFLDQLKHMKHLRFLSLQGISRISELPDSISKLTSLMILDLRACHNLEILPNGIDSLKCLTHLDMSECYLLSNMPKELSSLLELQVLKGFVFGNSTVKNPCMIEDLANLPKLRKLSIYTGVEDFPQTRELEALHKFKALRKLTFVWGGDSQGKSHNPPAKQENVAGNSVAADLTKPENKRDGKTRGEAASADAKQENRAEKFIEGDVQNPENGGMNIRTHNTASATDSPAPAPPTRRFLRRLSSLGGDRAVPAHFPGLPTDLEKLDLQCFPHSYAPKWLKASKLTKLNKLYIRGGTLCDLGQFEEVKDKWEVKILRLKFLNEMEMDWRELKEVFPKLIYLEKVKCPKLTLFPCDELGVWMSKTDKETRSIVI